MSESQAIVQQLLGEGYTRTYIARQLGRDQRLIGQIASGSRGPNYGAKHEGALAELRDKLAAARAGGVDVQSVTVAQPARRTTRTGAEARTRRPMTKEGRNAAGQLAGWGVSQTKRQATSSGAKRLGPQLAHIADEGRAVGFTLTLAPGVRVQGSGKGKRDHHSSGDQEVTFTADADELLELVDAHEGNVTEALAEWVGMTDRVESLDASDIRGIELRSWTP